MNTILNYISNYKDFKFFESIDEELIVEELKEPHLLALAKYLKSYGSKKNAWNNLSFSGLLGRYTLSWDKITEKDFDFYKAGDKQGISICKALFKHDDNFVNSIILLVNPNDDKDIKYLITYDKFISFHMDNNNMPSVSSSSGYKQKDIAYFCSKYDMMVLCLTDNPKFTGDLRIKRRNDNEGVIKPGDVDQYREIARKNIDRYKAILRKRKAERAAKDNISEKVKKILDDVMDLTTVISKDPVKYADCEYKIESLLTLCYNKKTYDSKRGNLTGSDGLLSLYNTYITSTLSMGKSGGYSYNSKEYDRAKSGIEEIIKKIENRINELKQLI